MSTISSVRQCDKVFCSVLCLCKKATMSTISSSNCALQCPAVCCSEWQCVAVCGSVLQCVAVCCSVLQCLVPVQKGGDVYDLLLELCVAVSCAKLQCVAAAATRQPGTHFADDMCCSVLQCSTVCCSVLQCAAVCCRVFYNSAPAAVRQSSIWFAKDTCVAVCCSVLQCVVVCCSVLQCVAVCFTLELFACSDTRTWHTFC